jgi:hypothetical protein
MHDYHESLPGYSPDQILHSGCGECAERSADLPLAIRSLDNLSFARAWKRAADWNRSLLDDVSRAEAPLLSVLWALQCRLEDRGFPIGECPDNSVNELAAFLAAPTSAETHRD